MDVRVAKEVVVEVARNKLVVLDTGTVVSVVNWFVEDVVADVKGSSGVVVDLVLDAGTVLDVVDPFDEDVVADVAGSSGVVVDIVLEIVACVVDFGAIVV